nr:DUF6192 family protein [Streptomyces caniscabiei]
MTQDSVERMVVWKVNYPESVQRKAGAVHGPVVGGSAAAVVITDFLHRPYVTSAVIPTTPPGTQATRPRSTGSAQQAASPVRPQVGGAAVAA